MKSFNKQEKIRFEHIDMAGIVFYPRFTVMINNLVESWFEEALNYPFHTMHPLNGVPTVDLQLSFVKPARLGEIISQELQVEELKNSSVVLKISFQNDENQTVLKARVVLVHVALRAETKEIQSSPWPDGTRARMQTFLPS